MFFVPELLHWNESQRPCIPAASEQVPAHAFVAPGLFEPSLHSQMKPAQSSAPEQVSPGALHALAAPPPEPVLSLPQAAKSVIAMKDRTVVFMGFLLRAR
jgi:hypothetical protein